MREEVEGYVNRKLTREQLYLTSLAWTGIISAKEAEKDFDQIQEDIKKSRLNTLTP